MPTWYRWYAWSMGQAYAQADATFRQDDLWSNDHPCNHQARTITMLVCGIGGGGGASLIISVFYTERDIERGTETQTRTAWRLRKRIFWSWADSWLAKCGVKAANSISANHLRWMVPVAAVEYQPSHRHIGSCDHELWWLLRRLSNHDAIRSRKKYIESDI